MTNINKLKALYNMQSHKAIELNNLLDNHLPRGYANLIVDRAKEDGSIVTSQVVRNVRSFIGPANLYVLSLLSELASQCKDRDTKASELIESAIKQ